MQIDLVLCLLNSISPTSIMKRFKLLSASLAVSAVCASFLPISASAQSIDSFFDIFTEVDLQLPDVQCDPCEVLRMEIMEKEASVTAKNVSITTMQANLSQLQSALQAAQNQLNEYTEALEEMQNPTNYVESDGRRYDSSDHAAMKRYAANLWSVYKAGGMSAQEYSDALAKPFDNPAVQVELAKLKKQIIKDLQNSITAVKADIQTAEEGVATLQQAIADEMSAVEALMDEIEKLLDQLEDCEDRCAEEQVNLPEDYAVTPGSKGFWDVMFGWFSGKKDDEVITVPGIDMSSKDVEEMMPGDWLSPDADALELETEDPKLSDNFWDIFTEVDVPAPICTLCEPLHAEIAEKKQELVATKVGLAIAQADQAANTTRLDQARSDVKKFTDALDAFTNPKDYVQDDQGNRFDSSDNAAMRERNARLWTGYKAGNMSAAELQAEWSKSFTDPSVQADLAKIKKQMKEAMEKAIEKAKKDVEAAEADQQKLADQIQKLQEVIQSYEGQITALEKKLLECQKLCAEKKDEEPKTAIPDFTGWIFEDGFESGDTSTWDQHHYVDPSPPTDAMVDVDAFVRGINFTCRSMQIFCPENKPPKTTGTDVDTDSFVEGINFTCRMMKLFCPEKKEDAPVPQVDVAAQDDGLLCRLFGWFCKDDEQKYEFRNLVDCAFKYGPECSAFDTNSDQKVDDEDLANVEFSLVGPQGLSFPIDVVGSHDITVSDAALLEGCVSGTGSCDDVTVGDPPTEALSSISANTMRDLTGEDFRIHLQNEKDDIVLGPPGNDFIQGTGSNDIFSNPLPNNSFGPSGSLVGEPFVFGPGGDSIIPPSLPATPGNINDWGTCLGAEPTPSCDENGSANIRVKLDLQPGETARCSVTVLRIGDRRFVIVKCVKVQAEKPIVTDPIDDFQGTNYTNGVPGGFVEESSSSVSIDPIQDYEGTNAVQVDPIRYIDSTNYGADYECEAPLMPDIACAKVCDGECVRVQAFPNGLSCYKCDVKEEVVKEQCDAPTATESACKSSCDGTCTKSYTRKDGVKCFECVEDKVEEEPKCPSGTTADAGACESQCASRGGTCVQSNGCYSCQVLNCPNGTFKNECPSSCPNGCDVAGEQGGTTCYACKQSCEDLCAQNGYGPESTDHSNAILSELNGYSCVSGANITIQTAKVGSCNCIGEYSLSVNTTPPVCSGTPCGDVSCGGSTSCQDGDTTITVNCNWGGWEKVQKHQFRPVFGN